MADEFELEDDDIEFEEEDEVADNPSGDGMPLGNRITERIQPHQIQVSSDGSTSPALDDNAAGTIVWRDYNNDASFLDQESWIAEWQLTDYLYQSPNYDRGGANDGQARAARISRFNVAKNANTMANQVRRGIFADTTPFLLEARGKLAGDPDAQMYLDAWTAIFNELNERADFEYNMELFIQCMALQGTAIAIPGWDERTVIRRKRKRVAPPAEVPMPDGSVKKINTWKSDKFRIVPERVVESYPFFEYRRLGTTIFDKGWRTPGRPELSAHHRIDIDFVNFQDLQILREMDCYKGIPDDEELIRYFLNSSQSDAEPATTVAQSMNMDTGGLVHAVGEERKPSHNPFTKPLKKLAYWTRDRVHEILIYENRWKTIRNEESIIGDHGLGYAANWWNIDNSGYGIGIGRLNGGDQRMDQGVLNEVLKMIAFPMNAPIVYNTAGGNAPTQNKISGLGTFWGMQGEPGQDVRAMMSFLQPPDIPKEAWQIYELGKEGGEDLVGANSTTMQGNLGGPGSSAMRTAAGVNRLGSKADENISGPVQHIEYVIKRWLSFLWKMVILQMPYWEIREILSDKLGEAILDQIDADKFMDVDFNIKILAGQKLIAKAAIGQLIPFLLQVIQQPQLMEYLHQKGWTINFKAIEGLFMQVSELQGRGDIMIPLTPEEKEMVMQSNPNFGKIQAAKLIEQLKQEGKLQEIDAKGKQDLMNTVIKTMLDKQDDPHRAAESGSVPLELAEARQTRNEDTNIMREGPIA